MKKLMSASAIAIALVAPAVTRAHAAPAVPSAIEPPMLAMPAGEFTMGSERAAVSQPLRRLQIKAFKMGKYEVTVMEFRQFIQATGYRTSRTCRQMAGKKGFAELPGNWQENTLPSGEFHPVTCIGWQAMHAYAQWLSEATGKAYRLPTEAEWEYASRAGSTAKYAHGNDEFEVCRYGNVADKSAEAALKRDYDGMESKNYVGVAPCDDQSDYASVVGMYLPNAFGLFDMVGNVAEVLQDCFHDNYQGAPGDGAAWITSDCPQRAKRGGSWHWQAPPLGGRGVVGMGDIGALEGFRLAQDIGGLPDSAVPASTRAFELALSKAQEAERALRAHRPKLP